MGVAVKQPRLALGTATIDNNNLFNSSEIFCKYKRFGCPMTCRKHCTSERKNLIFILDILVPSSPSDQFVIKPLDSKYDSYLCCNQSFSL